MRAGTLGFPQRVDGFEPLGGSVIEVGGRNAAAVVFGRGEQRLTYSIVEGIEHVNSYDPAGLYAPITRDADSSRITTSRYWIRSVRGRFVSSQAAMSAVWRSSAHSGCISMPEGRTFMTVGVGGRGYYA